MVCPTSPNGVTKCDGVQCQLTCSPGFHRCGDECKPDSSPLSCGGSCTPCPVPDGGEAACAAGSCQSKCPDGKVLCKSTGSCVAAGAPCNGECPTGKHECGGNCVSNNDVNSCGTSCTPCQAPENADAICDAGKCGWKCRTGYHQCGDKCLPNNSTASCGTQCSPCPSSDNGVATCTSATTCAIRCNDGFHACGNTCRSNSDPDACGTTCTKCAAPGAGRAICAAGKCDFDCPGGRKCGTTCAAAGAPCDGKCAAGETLCSGRCVPNAQVPMETCGNGADDDCDGKVDCADSSCGGVACGGGKVCMGTQCITPCAGGGSCDSNPGHSKCVPGTFACEGSARTCVDMGGSRCNNNQICSAGNCAACGGVNQPCCAGDRCTAGVCRGGTCAACGGLGQPCCAGSNCGSNVCRGGECGPACKTGDCTSNSGQSQCLKGTWFCDAAGNSTCRDAASKCGNGQICQGGTCAAACSPPPSGCTGNLNQDRCKSGVGSCSTGVPRCIDGPNKAAGSPCEGGKVCNGSGACVFQCPTCTRGERCGTDSVITTTGACDASTGKCVETTVRCGGKGCDSGTRACRECQTASDCGGLCRRCSAAGRCEDYNDDPGCSERAAGREGQKVCRGCMNGKCQALKTFGLCAGGGGFCNASGECQFCGSISGGADGQCCPPQTVIGDCGNSPGNAFCEGGRCRN